MRPGSIALMGVLVLGGAVTVQLDSARALEIGDPIPMQTTVLKNVDGRDLTLANVAGPHGTLVVFSCNACSWVRVWEERIATLGNVYRKRGFGIIAINPNDPTVVEGDGFERMKQRAREWNFEFPYVVDTGSQLARAFGATRTPEAFLFGATGRLVYHGTIDNSPQEPASVTEHYLRDALDAILAGRDIAVKETRAVGCTIKFGPDEPSPSLIGREGPHSGTSSNGG